MENKKNPLIAGIISAVPSLIASVVGIIKDKKEKKETEVKAEPTTTVGAVIESVKEITSGTISSKRLMNIAGTFIIVSVALTLIQAQGLTKLNLIMLCIGVGYSLGMSLITFFSEKK